MFKLIRDNIPELMAKDSQTLNYAVAQNDDFYVGLLRGKLIEEVNEYLASGNSIEELVDIKTVLDCLIGDRVEEFQRVYDEKLKEHGGFEKRYIGFFQDPPAEGARNVNAQTQDRDN
jgi:predicted house-cleaning noncanonical NTP pyrophosphatase (MazG superfamily)